MRPGETTTRRHGPAVALVVAGAIAAGLVQSVSAGRLPPVAGLMAVAIVVTTIFWQLRAHLPSILLVFVAVLLATVVATQRVPKLRGDRLETQEAESLSRAWRSSGAFDERLPIVVHLVFDEMMSPGAITDDLPGAAEIRQSLQAFGARHGLRMFDSVYGRYFFSGESLSNLMNPEYEGRTRVADVFTEQQPVVTVNLYFDDLAEQGYRTIVFQTSLMNFCANSQVDLCETFDSFDPGGEGGGMDVRSRAATLWQTGLRAYEPSYVSAIGDALLRRVYRLGTRPLGVLGVADRYDVQRFPDWFDRFAAFAATVPRGTHLFAHFLVPHAPYLLTENCFVSGTFDAGYYLARYPAAEQPEKRRHYYESYFAQLRCLQQKLDDLLLAIQRSENYRDAVIVIHGDHGSRISRGNILEDHSERDFVDNYATFFAVRSPAVAAGVDCEFVSLPQIFRRHVAGKGAAPPAVDPLPVVVMSRAAGNARVEAPMPRFGCSTESVAPPRGH